MAVLFIATGESLARVSSRRDGEWSVRLTLEGRGVQCLALDPHHRGTLYAGTQREGVWKSTDEGMTWENTHLAEPAIFSLAVSAADGTLYAGCEPSKLFRSPDGGRTWQELEALRQIPSAPTWSFPPRPWTSHVRWIAPCPHEANRLLVGIELGGLMLSEDGGATWTDHRPGAQRDVHALAWHPDIPGRAYETGGGGAAWSRDGGRTWQAVDAGRDRHYCWALAVDPDDPDCWFISASPGPRQAHYGGHAQAQIYRWSGNGPWQSLGGGLPDPLDSMPYALSFVGGDLFAGLADGCIYVSPDRGETWRPLALDGDRLPAIVALDGFDLPLVA
ncbi:MAG: hypothetical protein IRY99_04725 [Isosphaeraceae bacterium]|nr:hypothetical protein [Isosphaeraceae bacterium]